MVSKFLRQPVGEEEKGEKKRKEEEGEEEEEEEEGEGEEGQTKVCFYFKSSVFWIPKVLVWRIVLSFLRFCGRDHPNPRFVEVMGGKTPIGEN